MAPTTLAKSRNTKKPASNDSKTTAPVFTPNRQLTRTPPPSENPRIAGTPLTTEPEKAPTAQPDEVPATQPDNDSTDQPNKGPNTQLDEARTTQTDMEPVPSTSTTATQKISLDDAMNALNVALNHVSEAYQKTITNLNKNEDHSHITVETPFYAFEEIGRKLTRVKQYLSQQKTNPTEMGEYFSHLEQTLKETITTTVKEMITNTGKETIATTVTQMRGEPKTWAQVAAEGGTLSLHAELAKRERIEKAKRARAKTEVVQNLRNSSDTTKDKVESLSDKALTETLQEHILEGVKRTNNPPIKIRGAKKMSKHTIKIQCHGEQDASALQKFNWEALEGATVIKTTYGVLIHGVPKQVINPGEQSQEEAKAALEENYGIKAVRITTLMRRIRNPKAPTHSIVVFMETPEEADSLINDGFRGPDRYYYPVRYMPQCQVRQCFNCQGYGHKADVCTRKPVCGKCAQDHETRKCTSEKVQCANCEGTHVAWDHTCPKRQQENERVEILKNIIPPTFAST